MRTKIISFFSLILGFTPIQSWKQRLVVVLAHVVVWIMLLFFPLFIMRVQILDVRFFYREILVKSSLILIFYIHYYFLLPRFFAKKQFGKYIFFIVIAISSYLVIDVVAQNLLRPFFRSMPGQPAFFKAGEKLTYDSVRFDQRRPFFPPEQNDSMRPQRNFPPANNESMPPPPDFSRRNRVDPMPPMLRPNRDAEWIIFGKPFYITPFQIMNALTSVIVILLVSAIIRLGHSLYLSQKRSKQLETEKLNAELNWLKLQINPHFLFNTLNSIYSQAHLKSSETESSILKFSGIMRYVIYDSHADKVPLEKDLTYIKNYIDLQKIRLSKQCTVEYQEEGNAAQLLIAPLLLITFIENAFKHGISYNKYSFININISIHNQLLTLTVKNSIVESGKIETESGIGIENALKRLKAIYKDRFQLDISTVNEVYVVNLKIELDDDA
ncbi:sensor histidine kinase [Gynurincola endophyticus]|uniref:sensor histidine kinase n=1 Tax=Gynurincola endophyticus TaxID=2479004 RepID=UPI000F8DFAD6|nr:sensor histidine kinase [Gynurincola endophyticus]